MSYWSQNRSYCIELWELSYADARIEQFANDVVNDMHNRQGITNEEHKENIKIGKYAEEAFALFLYNESGISLSIDYNIYPGVENGDSHDFQINGKEIEIKSSRDTDNRGFLACYDIFNFLVFENKPIKDITVAILYDYNITTFVLTSWIDYQTYENNYQIKPFRLSRYNENYKAVPLKRGHSIATLTDYILYDIL